MSHVSDDYSTKLLHHHCLLCCLQMCIYRLLLISLYFRQAEKRVTMRQCVIAIICRILVEEVLSLFLMISTMRKPLQVKLSLDIPEINNWKISSNWSECRSMSRGGGVPNCIINQGVWENKPDQVDDWCLDSEKKLKSVDNCNSW